MIAQKTSFGVPGIGFGPFPLPNGGGRTALEVGGATTIGGTTAAVGATVAGGSGLAACHGVTGCCTRSCVTTAGADDVAGDASP